MPLSFTNVFSPVFLFSELNDLFQMKLSACVRHFFSSSRQPFYRYIRKNTVFIVREKVKNIYRFLFYICVYRCVSSACSTVILSLVKSLRIHLRYDGPISGIRNEPNTQTDTRTRVSEVNPLKPRSSKSYSEIQFEQREQEAGVPQSV